MPANPNFPLKPEPVVALSLGAIFLFFIISVVIADHNLQTLHSDTQAVFHSGDVIAAVDQVLTTVQDAETGQRGFLLTGDESYLQPYNNALAAISPQLDHIALLTSGSSAEQAELPALRAQISAKLAELAQTIALRRSQGLAAALALVNTNLGKDQMDNIRGALDKMRQQEASLRKRLLSEMASAYDTALISSLASGMAGLLLTFVVGYLIRRATMIRRREEWLKAGQVGIATAMLGDQEMAELGENILSFFAEYLGAVAGAIYKRHGDHFRRIATYGVLSNAEILERFASREGLLGQAAADNRQMEINEVPEGYLEFGSALGHGKPRHLLISPAAVDHQVNAVMELGFIQPPSAQAGALLQEASSSVAISLRSARYRTELRSALEETQQKSEELQVQGEELRVSNEELEEQSRALKESQARLEQQQVELEQTNAQLEEQARQLETQRDDLENAYGSVQLKARELEQASRYKSDFLANMSHELRTPLNSALILAKLLADNPAGNLTPEQVKFAQTIRSAGNDLLTLINDILDLSKIEAGHVEIRPETISLRALIENLAKGFEPVARERNLEFATALAPECPEVVVSDHQRLEQILKNLLSNAFKFTEAGKVTLAIRRSANDRIAISVTDTGIGIPEAQQQSIFDAFRQADGTISRRFGGTGLGLSISRELVRLLGGSILLQSTPGHGSAFTIILPERYDPALVEPRSEQVARPVASGLDPVAAAPRPRAAAARITDDRDKLEGAGRSLLIIEDDPDFATILRDLAREKGFSSLVAETADEALNLARQFKPSAILLDVGLPDHSGLSVLDHLKRDVETRHIPVHVISAADHSQVALSLGAMGYMVKPVAREDLAAALSRLEDKLSQRMRRVLIVEDDRLQREAVSRLLSSHDVETVSVGTAAECLDRLRQENFDCMVLDLSLPDASGYNLLETLSHDQQYAFPPVIVYTGRDLSADDERRLQRYSKSIIIKGAKSPERLLDEVTLFLHQVVSELPPEQQRMIRKAQNRDDVLERRRILIVEDDIRNVYALTNILEPRGVQLEIARNGSEAISVLNRCAEAGTPVDLVLMDVMMPVMDGLTATREIRKNPDWRRMPIITLTAKAMPDDQQRCIAAGANDYMAKPLDVEKLLSLVRVWMPR